ncbi:MULTISPECIES: DUF1223 domain-containing protein [Phyllobacteriaceae]|jgi:hypothetical protein|uniref:DUF1223 domain-containing protein n=1 Tax=Mesorhizobium hungaricum TaxID=1566387 RepID=A0A1C2DEK7_9HYPH|nr:MULTISPECIES: DUF1223 domain-containing protein [Mesorhizobium]MBN9232684.1 DUF1223 domain-containing protein [Mesorhizobium sp.]MDQ0330281.1 hypothetical protein [Mesorhizobium sp. YL-MeA3-2017]OCX13209.1 hypothetical protein QV13_27190 [Mesorhizobium hungaricum]
MSSRKPLLLAAAGLAVSMFAGAALAADSARPLGVIELFTSQGNKSCPPADRYLAEIAAKGDVIALAYHVDYWDYLGWQDSFARKENTERQYGYMRAFNGRSVYTPQAVINGRADVNGASREAISGTLNRLSKAGRGMQVDIKVSSTPDGVAIEAGDAPSDAGGVPGKAHVVIVYFNPPQVVNVGKGENDGRRMIYWNAVSDVQTAGMWYGKSQRYDLPASEISKAAGSAVLLQAVSRDGLLGPIIGAAFIRRPSL